MSWKQTICYFNDLLLEANKLRPEKDYFLENGEVAWAVYERNLMLEAAKELNSSVTLENILEAENNALGHSDYVWTFAINCAKLVNNAPVG